MQQHDQIVNLWPTQASTFAWEVDLFYIAMIAVSAIFTVAIAGVLVYFAIRYRRREGDYRPPHVETSKMLELVWTVIPLFLVVGMFFWGAELFFKQMYVPENALPIDVTGKQWMFKFQHPNGRREINALHIPIGQPIKLTMASEDVIHNLFIPDFRVKHDLVPGRYTAEWFQATKAGEYHLFCNQYCGTEHSNMIGTVYVMQQADYQNWLSGFTGKTPAEAGEELFTKQNCNTCHSMDGGTGRGPSLVGIIGSKVQLNDGTTIDVDKNYIRESILKPQEKVVMGYTPIMPSFQGILNEEQVDNLIKYIETLTPATGAKTSTPGQAVAASPGHEAAATQPGHGAPAVQPAATSALTPPTAATQPAQTPQAPPNTAEPVPVATPSATPAASPSPAVTPAPKPEATPAPTETPASTPTPAAAPTAAPSPNPSPTATPAAPAPTTAATPAVTPVPADPSSTAPKEVQ